MDAYPGVADKGRFDDDLAICRAKAERAFPAPSPVPWGALFGAAGGAGSGLTMGPIYVHRAKARGQCMAALGYKGVSR